MRPILYLTFFSLFFSLNLTAQEKYSTMTMEDWVDGGWKTTSKYSNAFDSNGNIIKVTIEIWNELFGKMDKTVINHTLNANATINYSITQMWDNEVNDWIDSQKTIFTYDASKRVLTEKVQMWIDPDWMDISITINSYANGLLINKISKNGVFGEMNNFMQIIYSYNSDGAEYQTVIQMWDALSETWKNQMQSTNTYDSSKKIIFVLTENSALGEWIKNMKSTFSYNIDGTVKESLGQDWVDGYWVDSWKEFQSYNINGTVKEMLIMDWSTVQSKWENGSRWTYTYDASSIVQPELTGTDQLKVFPNPFNNVISIELGSSKISSIQIYNTNGQLLRNIEKGEPLSAINLSAFKSGVYLLKVNSPESQKVIKMLKNK